MKTQDTATTRRIGAGLTLAAGIIELVLFYLLPAFDAYFFKLTPYQVLRAGDLLDYQRSTCVLLTVLAIGGALACAALSVAALILPETPHHNIILLGIGSAYLIGLVPYVLLLIAAASDSYANTIKFSSLIAYILCTGVIVAGFAFLGAKAVPAASPTGPDPAPSYGGSETHTDNACQQLVLVRMNTQEHFPILSTSPGMILGRSASDANIIVDGNGLIGRQHAKISYQNGQFCITDLNSKNKTYLNDLCLQPSVSCVLKQGDYITLANEVFAVESIGSC